MSSASENQTIGPYRVIGSLGKGGMGEVLLAKDPRLHRKVAIKQVRGEEHPEARRRFQREARLAASLSHASIVSIFDFVEQEDHEYLVMELVDGPSLKVWLEGQVSFGEKLRVAEQIAAGLQYAHRFGVVHRDLKTENVLITPEGQAKIADFGIARRLDAADELTEEETAGTKTRDRTELLTREGALIGTYRSMAPEQAQGERADFRSDLFSFGVLLYEMFAGLSPFLAEKPLDTLFNLVSRPHPDLDQVAPGLPRPLVRLIDQLLEKDRDLRPRSADEVLQQLLQIRRTVEEASGATLGATGTLGASALKVPTKGRRPAARGLAAAAILLLLMMLLAWLVLRRTQVREPLPVVIAVLPVSGFETAGLLGSAKNRIPFLIRDTVQRELGALRGYVPSAASEVDEVLKERLQGKLETAAALGVDELVEPQLSCDGYHCLIQLNRWRADGSPIGLPKPTSLSIYNMVPMNDTVKALTRQVFGPSEVGISIGDQGQEVLPEDREELLAVRIALYEDPSTVELSRGYEKLKELWQKDRRWLEPLLLQIDLKLVLYKKSHQREHLEDARKCMREALQLAPEELIPLLLAVHIEVLSGDLARAKEYLAKATELEPLDSRLIDLQALVLEQDGKLDEALAKRKEAYGRWPSWIRTLSQARTHMKLFEWQEARRILAPVLEKAPEFRRALSLQAELELTVGEVDKAVPLYRSLLARFDESIYAVNLATALYLAGEGKEAMAVARRELEKDKDNPFLQLLYADAARLAGEEMEATALYRKISAVDFSDTTSWQVYSLWAQAHARLAGHSEKATNYIDKACELAGADPLIDVDAALVYTLLGDAVRAKRHIESVYRAGKKGWLRQGEFERWRADPNIQRYLPPKGVG